MDRIQSRMRQRGLVMRFPCRPDQLIEAATPLDSIFTLAHFGIPEIETQQWTIRIDGMVRHSIVLTLDDVMRWPKRTVLAVHECAGNPLNPTEATRGVANVVWGGADLREIFEDAGIDSAARFVWSYGVDHGEFGDIECESYLKDLPLDRLAKGDVILAYEMNRERLTVEHGAPVRLFVPGYYGTNSVKWLRRMTIADRRADGPMTTVLYNDEAGPSRVGGRDSSSRPVWEIAPESVIVAPAPNAELRAGKAVEIWGWAWAARGIAHVEVSTDAGATYESAELDDREQWSWQRFSYEWIPASAGKVTVSCRATDSDGATQPPTAARNSIHKTVVSVAIAH
ncbi:MAG: molybdopterin-dependent oxidoreductase [Candidatus Acidiferrales bacterium]